MLLCSVYYIGVGNFHKDKITLINHLVGTLVLANGEVHDQGLFKAEPSVAAQPSSLRGRATNISYPVP